MDKKSFDYLKALASLENCIDVLEEYVKNYPKDLDLDSLRTSVEHLRFWFNNLIEDYEAR